MTAHEPHDRVLVSPRYLAGAGDRLTDAIGPLVHLFGWPGEYDRARGLLSLSSPDGGLYVNFNSHDPHGRWWSITHHEPFWEARFTRQTPIEAIAAVTQALPQLLGDPRHVERIPLTTSTPVQIADLNDWHSEGNTLTSPDGHCRLQHTPEDEIPWRFRHHVHDGVDTHWEATFTQDTPERIVGQFFTHLATSTPVERAFRDLPYLVQRLDDVLITPVRTTALPPDVHHAVAQLHRSAGRA
ncbi:DUF317 domain-containing protein [Streptomyces acidiscabies]|uniref:DUF317 domain-containing protein n=1 Tax=Streptomyces acidiscabies TaxID=42234 RepID=A0AAP6EK69_9ACTN|nr:DUF317 domain-containing protein [Streptomyces acidiscabies]MBZ3916690.1 DUF317 domain-containing protein [Streptomyces acidiscabies]MDX2965673.1 DUF317 domain-containing protein [Streptomyces acidiscabies]MDX3024825.1 DUF317 domain-containing protein [Streptomyces acidiscabies]MDX3795589.1 DUF317 domain-containing protein [Streptomyces acidiscabies]